MLTWFNKALEEYFPGRESWGAKATCGKVTKALALLLSHCPHRRAVRCREQRLLDNQEKIQEAQLLKRGLASRA